MTTNNIEPNRLIKEKSPYLLQHAYNPVDWYPWSEEAFKKAKEEDKLIFLSIGYSTCHWCHVMERESFEDEEVAEALNKDFIAIKVDREERPDLDNIYMNITQALTGQGGWPMNVFITPEQKPIYAGTYFPKRSIMNRIGLLDVLEKLSKAWKEKKNELIESSENIIEALNRSKGDIEGEELDKSILEDIFEDNKRSFDPKYGGFGNKPKFPMAHNLLQLLRYWKDTGDKESLEMVEKTLQGMYKGGIFDHIGYGFSRYSVDEKWLVPHFEKMLYDNALLAFSYLEGYQATKKPIYKEVAEKIFTYIIRDMTSEEGGFYSAEDADSEGEEGKFYVWDPEEIKDILGDEEANLVCNYYDITEKGNFEGKSIPNLIKQDIKIIDKSQEFKYRVHAYTDMLFYAREKRVHPHKDDKILTSWNGLMIAALAYGSRILENGLYIKIAERAIDFIYKNLFNDEGRLLARYRDGEAKFLGYLEDYSFLTWGLIELYEATFKVEYLEKALNLMEESFRLFWDKDEGGFYINGHDGEKLVLRPKDIYDGAIPSGNSVAALNMLRLDKMAESERYTEKFRVMLKKFSSEIKDNPPAYSFFLMAYMYYLKSGKSIVISIKEKDDLFNDMIKEINEKYLPFISVVANDNSNKLQEIVPSIKYKKIIDGKTTAYICEDFTCNMPTNDLDNLKEQLK
ncbi:thioredoxin domain-containing protein [Clostridium sp. D2Q-11]|uniref:Thioredoxin domain-containing protein n=1 Tax=Anaeromonas frigoriresistens TaxID=2683708 RepID=A0A942UWV3_9FIRM|nr:thioredoxin domain-containing protein [Anaeromonas frigoriresistens]MBS4538376.1 thioredoxin domain-containing protein [Anaeromonas frigoriresistens]